MEKQALCHDKPNLSDADGAYLKLEADLFPQFYFADGDTCVLRVGLRFNF